MKTVNLEVREEQASGNVGLCLSCLPYMTDEFFLDSTGLIIAHDLLEHDNGLVSDPYIEQEALGACWYIRGQHGQLSQQPSYHAPHTDLASDLSRQFVDYGLDMYFPRNIDRVKLSDAFKCDLKDIKRSAYKMIKSELNYSDAQFSKSDIKLWLKRAIKCMQVGIRKARKRFPDSYQANRLFFNICDAVAPYTDSEYGEFKLSYEYSTGRATCEEVYPDDLY